MKLSPETKHVLIIGGALIVAVLLAIVVYKKFEANSQASQAASDQSEQDQLAYLESLMEGGSYGGYSDFGDVSGSAGITMPTAPASSMSLADELQQIESAFGFGSSASSGTSSASGGSSSTGSSSDAGSDAAQTTHSLGSGAKPGQPRAGAILEGEYELPPSSGIVGSPIMGGPSIYSILDEPVSREGSYVA